MRKKHLPCKQGDGDGANFNSKPVEINKPLHSNKTRMNRIAHQKKKRDTESNETTLQGSHWPCHPDPECEASRNFLQEGKSSRATVSRQF